MDGFFPLSAKATNIKGLLISVAIYFALSIVSGFILHFFIGLPVIGVAVGFVSQLIDLYCWGGIVVSIMKCANVI